MFGRPEGVAVDATGNVYVSDSVTRRVRKIDAAGIITNVAGDGNGGYFGDSGPATAAPLNSPQGLALDQAGNLYVADGDDNRIRRVAADGTIQTLAGTGTAGFSGDGGPALAAQLSGPTALAVDAAGNLYILRCRKLARSQAHCRRGHPHSSGGGPEVPGCGDGGTARSASLLSPGGIAIGISGNLYIADRWHYRVRKVSTTGIITDDCGWGSDIRPGSGRHSGCRGAAGEPSGGGGRS